MHKHNPKNGDYQLCSTELPENMWPISYISPINVWSNLDFLTSLSENWCEWRCQTWRGFKNIQRTFRLNVGLHEWIEPYQQFDERWRTN